MKLNRLKQFFIRRRRRSSSSSRFRAKPCDERMTPSRRSTPTHCSSRRRQAFQTANRAVEARCVDFHFSSGWEVGLASKELLSKLPLPVLDPRFSLRFRLESGSLGDVRSTFCQEKETEKRERKRNSNRKKRTERETARQTERRKKKKFCGKKHFWTCLTMTTRPEVNFFTMTHVRPSMSDLWNNLDY